MLYLPLAALGLLALGTYWMVQSTPQIEVPVPKSSPSHEPDYFLQNFSIKSFDTRGQLRTEISGTQAKHFGDSEWLNIDNIVIRSFDRKGRLTTASARQGLTNEDHSQVKLIGDAHVIREAASTEPGETSRYLEYKGEFLHAFMNSEQITSNEPVTLFRDSDQFTADTLDFDNTERVLILKGRVRGTITPAVHSAKN